MANRGNFQRRGNTTDLVGRTGQFVTGLPTGNQESSVLDAFRIEGHDGYSFQVPVYKLITLVQPRDAVADKSSTQINQPFGFIGVNQPRSFNVNGGGLTTYYKMRGYYVTGAVYETFVVAGS